MLLATPLEWAVDRFQLRFSSWPKHLVTPLTADSPHCQKSSKNKNPICITNKTLTITFYSLSLPWKKKLGNCQEAQNAIAPPSRTTKTLTAVVNICVHLPDFVYLLYIQYNRTKFSDYVFC